MNTEEQWNSIYRAKSEGELSWTQSEPILSLSLIAEACPSGRVIDVGSGRSVLAERLLERGYEVAVLDISDGALELARTRLGARSSQIEWIAGDVSKMPRLGSFDVWHDRAVFHFLTDPTDRAAYVRLFHHTVPPGGHAVIATFAPDGPEECSGLRVRRYDAAMLAGELGPRFALIRSVAETHLTPWGRPQSFQYCLFSRV